MTPTTRAVVTVCRSSNGARHSMPAVHSTAKMTAVRMRLVRGVMARPPAVRVRIIGLQTVQFRRGFGQNLPPLAGRKILHRLADDADQR